LEVWLTARLQAQNKIFLQASIFDPNEASIGSIKALAKSLSFSELCRLARLHRTVPPKLSLSVGGGLELGWAGLCHPP
jgi:hypothetical protein